MVKYKPRIDIINMTGKVIGDLTVIESCGSGKYRGMRWLCACSCGNKTVAYGGHLRAGKRVSCGCKSQSRIFKTGLSNLFNSYRRKSLAKKREFNLSIEQFSALISSNCFYCNIEPSNILRRQKSKKTQMIYNGIDRKDPSIGYNLDNCVAACWLCNFSKQNLMISEWLDHIKRIVKWQKLTDFI